MIGALRPGVRIASVFLTPACDMGCSFCAADSSFDVMSFAQAASLLDELRRRGVGNVVLGGGEPWLWPHGPVRLAERARRDGFIVQVCTNGIALPEGFERIDAVRRWILPIESMDPVTHDRLRAGGEPGHLARVLDRIDALAGSGRELTVSTVVTGESVDLLEPIAEHLATLPSAGVALHAWHLYRFVPVGRGGERVAGRLGVDAARFRGACAELRRRHPGLTIYRRDDLRLSSSVEFFRVEGGRLRVGWPEPPGVRPPGPAGAG